MRFALALLLSLQAPFGAAKGAGSSCTTVPGFSIGGRAGTFSNEHAGSLAKCCSRCQAAADGRQSCALFTFEPKGGGGGTCFLKNTTAGTARTARAGATSGCVTPAACGSTPPPPPPAQFKVAVNIDTGILANTIDPGFKCWNIDASTNRGWLTRDLSSPVLRDLAAKSLPGYLRFGGSGNDGLRYALDMSAAGSPGNRCAPRTATQTQGGPFRCMNRTWVDNLCGFAKHAGAKLVWGLNIWVCDNHTKNGPAVDNQNKPPCVGQAWDTGEARALMAYLIKAKHEVYGYELGNEQNTHYTPDRAAQNFLILSNLLTEMYPDATTRPKIVGPDVHGFHGDPLTSGPEKPKLEYLNQFGPSCKAHGVPLHAMTHHEYIEVDPGQGAGATTAPPQAAQLNITNLITKAVNETLSVSAPGVQIWAGEIGPHNGGSPPCDHSSMRWANFGDSFWYLDAMGVKAAGGYSVFCRQDFIGADYGLVDCMSESPLPDYYSGILWSKLMGQKVLKVTTDSESLRAYAHCSANSSATPGVTVLLLNLSPNTPRSVALSGVAVGDAVEWHLTGPNGTASVEMALNGAPLRAQKNGAGWTLPSLAGKSGSSGAAGVVTMAPSSIAFVQLSVPGGAKVCQ